MKEIDELLQSREAKGLRYTVSVRMFLALSAVPAAIFITQNTFEILLYIFLSIIGIIAGIYFFILLANMQKLNFVGLGGATLDLMFLCTLPAIWYLSVGGREVSPAFLLKTQLPVMCLLYIVINSLAIRPLYPAIISLGSVVVHLCLLPFVLPDSRTVLSHDFVEVFLGEAVSLEIFFGIIIVILLVGGFMTFLTHTARKTIHEAVALEHEKMEIQERQNQLIMQGKMNALSDLVAGIAHELNNPIGAVQSAADILNRCIDKITDIIENCQTIEEIKNSEQFQRSLRIFKDNNQTIAIAAHRITKIVVTLKNFAQLDEASFQKADIHVGLESTLTLVEHEFNDRISVVKEYGDIPRVSCYPGELNQVIMTLLTNAAQAIKGEGTITIRTFMKNNEVHIQISDTGVGISPEKLERLFNPDFSKKGSRVKARLGLFTSYNIVQKHHGEIIIESKVGRGTTFTIILPIEPEKDVENN